MKNIELKIYGKVQGVFFRLSAKEMADKLHLSGWAKNEPDGSVSIEVEGRNEDVEKFVDWCFKGPEDAEVEKVDTSEGEIRNLKGFKAD